MHDANPTTASVKGIDACNIVTKHVKKSQSDATE